VDALGPGVGGLGWFGCWSVLDQLRFSRQRTVEPSVPDPLRSSVSGCSVSLLARGGPGCRAFRGAMAHGGPGREEFGVRRVPRRCRRVGFAALCAGSVPGAAAVSARSGVSQSRHRQLGPYRARLNRGRHGRSRRGPGRPGRCPGPAGGPVRRRRQRRFHGLDVSPGHRLVGPDSPKPLRDASTGHGRRDAPLV
jgi:hypothetical protein